MKVIICTWRIREWELQILNWSSSVQPEIVPLFTISFQCLKKKFKSWQVYDWLAKWLIMSGYMDLRRPRVYRRSNVGLVFSCYQAALWMVQSVRLSVRPSVTPFWLCSHHLIIMKFSGVITSYRSDVHAKGQGQRSKVKVTEVTTQLNRFRTVTPVWIHIWWWNDTYSLIMLRRGTLLFFKVIRQIWRSHGSKNRRIWPRLGVSRL